MANIYCIILLFLMCFLNQSMVILTKSSCPYTPDGCMWLSQEDGALFCNNLHARFNKTALENEKIQKCKSSMVIRNDLYAFDLIFKHCMMYCMIKKHQLISILGHSELVLDSKLIDKIVPYL